MEFAVADHTDDEEQRDVQDHHLQQRNFLYRDPGVDREERQQHDPERVPLIPAGVVEGQDERNQVEAQGQDP